MTKIIDLQERRRQQDEEDNAAYIVACDCGCAMFRLYVSGEVMCLNCEADIIGLHVDINAD